MHEELSIADRIDKGLEAAPIAPKAPELPKRNIDLVTLQDIEVIGYINMFEDKDYDVRYKDDGTSVPLHVIMKLLIEGATI